MTMTMMKTVEKEENKQPSQKTQQATMTTTKTTASNAVGERMIAALEGLLSGIQSQNLTVHEKDVAVVNRCFGYGNNTAVECHGKTTNDVTQSQTYAALHGFLQMLKNDPTKRYHVVDQDCSTQTEDAIWLSIPKWQYDICRHQAAHKTTKTAVAVAQLQCVVTTVRSLERSVFYQCYNNGHSAGNWKVQEGIGPRGSAMVTLVDTSTSAPETTTSTTETSSSSSCPFGGIQAVFSDQPRHVAYTGHLLSKLSAQQQQDGEDKKKAKKNGDVILRVFRCAPRPSLQQGIANVLVQQTSGDIHDGDNVFDLWIRHVEIPENLPGIGTFVHNATDDHVSLLQLLTEVHVPESLDSDHDGNKLAKSLDFVVASTMHPVSSVNRTTTTSSSSSSKAEIASPSSTDASPPALVQDDEEEEKEEEEPAAPLCASVSTTPVPRAIEPLNTSHDDDDDDVNASSKQQQPSSLQTPAAFAPNEFSNQALLSQQQHPSLVTPLVSMASAAAAASSDNTTSSEELYRNNGDPAPAMLVLDEEKEDEEALCLTSPPRSSASTGMAKEKVVDSPASTSGSELDNEKHEGGCNEPNVSGSASKKDVAETQAMNDDDDDVLGDGGGGGDVATTTTMASTNKDPSIASDEDDNDAPPPVTSVETTTVTEPNDARKNKQNKKAAAKKAGQQNKVAEKSNTNADKKQKQGGGKKKIPTKDDKEASAGTHQTKNAKALDSTIANRDAPRKNENNEMTKDMSKVVATNNDVPVSTINNSCSSLPPPPPHENTKTVTEKKNPAAVVPNHTNNNAQQRHVVGPICKACNLHKPKSEFSAAQLKKKDKRCKDCIQTNRFVQSENK